MSWELNGRTALITGGASGIGAELARQLSARGVRVGLVDRDPEALAAAAPSGAETAVANVRDGAALSAAVDDLAQRLGGLDIVVANAGIATGGPLRMVSSESFEDTVDTNLLGVWRTVRAALPHVLARRGYLLLVASAAAVAPSPGLGAYSTSKAGVEALGRVLRVELGPHGVAVGVAYYLFLATPMVQQGERMASFTEGRDRLPKPLGRTYPLEPAVADTVRGIERRARRVTHPRLVRAMIALRTLLDTRLADVGAHRSVMGMEEAFAAEAARVGADAASRPPHQR